MPRRSLQEELTSALREYLAIAEFHSPEEYPLDIKSVAAALRTSRTTLYKYGLDKDIAASNKRQLERANGSDRRTRRHTLEETNDDLKARLRQAEEQNKLLIIRIMMVEANAPRHGINPEELYRPIFKPVRTVSQAGNNRTGGKRRWTQQN